MLGCRNRTANKFFYRPSVENIHKRSPVLRLIWWKKMASSAPLLWRVEPKRDEVKLVCGQTNTDEAWRLLFTNEGSPQNARIAPNPVQLLKILGFHTLLSPCLRLTYFHVRSQLPHASPEPKPVLLRVLHHCGLRLARQSQVNVRVIPIRDAVHESVELAHDIYSHVSAICRRRWRRCIDALHLHALHL